MSRSIAKPIFSADDVVEEISNPLPKCAPIDIDMDDSDDSTIEELPLDLNRPLFTTEKAVWDFIERQDVKDRSQRRNRWDNNQTPQIFTNEYNNLSELNKKGFSTYYKEIFAEIYKVFSKNNVWGKLERVLDSYERSSLLLHVIMRGQTLYNTILTDPLFVGYMVAKQKNNDEFTTYKEFVAL